MSDDTEAPKPEEKPKPVEADVKLCEEAVEAFTKMLVVTDDLAQSYRNMAHASRKLGSVVREYAEKARKARHLAALRAAEKRRAGSEAKDSGE